MTGARERDETAGRPSASSPAPNGEETGAAARGGAVPPESGAGGDAPDGRGATAGEPARTEATGAPAPATATATAPAGPVRGGPATTDRPATTDAVAADPVAVADPVSPAPATPAAVPASGTGRGREPDRPLLAPSERDELDDRLLRAAGRFVDDPPGAVDDAVVILGDLGERVAALLAERRDACRDLTRQARATEGAANAQTESLRLALRDSRDLAERLLKL
ncbi:hypothetical protein [Streptomyces sp. NPDC004134]|uniref:hypothetical protein n=1 Tax=Streptomyces sp. NPDC004134 TaxID=3364691 RepID=UPI003699359A